MILFLTGNMLHRDRASETGIDGSSKTCPKYNFLTSHHIETVQSIAAGYLECQLVGVHVELHFQDRGKKELLVTIRGAS